MYCGEIQCVGLSFALKLGLHPSTIACLGKSSINLPKWVDGHKPSFQVRLRKLAVELSIIRIDGILCI
jgi:hypothetical protein